VIELSRYVFEVLRKDKEFILYRGRSKDDGPRVLVLSTAAEYPAANSLKRLQHECSLREELDAAWAARPIAITRYWDRVVLVFEDPGGVPLAQLLGPEQPLDLAFSLRLAISVSIAIIQMHQRGIIHKDIKPANIPLTVSAIVMKLLAKTSEERYQTAAGVERDLRRCLVEWERGRAGLSSEALAKEGARPYRIEEFPLGEYDTPDRLQIPEKLYGRTREIEALFAAFDRVVRGRATELVLVSGYSGIGKSSVVNELQRALVPTRGLFTAGKFDQYKRDIPYSTLAQAFQNLVRALLGKSDAELMGWRDALLEALGPNGRLMVDIVPELKLIIGEQPSVPELPPQDAQRRFQLVFRRFIDVFASPEHPLALFLDDLQWLDGATLDLLEDLLTQPDVQDLILIGAYRDNEVTAAHPLIRKLDAIRSAGRKLTEIRLAPLAREDLGHLVGDALRCEFELYLAAGAALLPGDAWEHRYELSFELELHRAECEFLTGGTAAEERLSKLSEHAHSLVDVAAVASLQEVLYTTLDRLDRSIEVGLDYLRKVGINWTAHPTKEEVVREYEEMLARLEKCPIEQMAELPRMSNPESRAAVEVLTELVPAAYFTDLELCSLVVCRIANMSLEKGNSNGSVYAYSLLGFLLRTRFGNHDAGFRFGRLALKLSDESERSVSSPRLPELCLLCQPLDPAHPYGPVTSTPRPNCGV